MKKSVLFLLGVSVGGFLGFIFAASRNGIASNSGSEFYGSEFAELLKTSGSGIGNNNGSKFYSDAYIKEVLKINNSHTE